MSRIRTPEQFLRAGLRRATERFEAGFGETSCEVSDIDMFVEHHGAFLFGEFKRAGEDLSTGQRRSYCGLSNYPQNTVLIFWTTDPDRYKSVADLLNPDNVTPGEVVQIAHISQARFVKYHCNTEQAIGIVGQWFAWAHGDACRFLITPSFNASTWFTPAIALKAAKS